MKYLLDTNATIRLVQRHAAFERRLRQHNPEDRGLSVIVRQELYFGTYKSRDVQGNLDRIAALRFELVPFDDDDARFAGQIRASLSANGQPIGSHDTLIAGQSLARTREFSRVPGLRIEDWEI